MPHEAGTAALVLARPGPPQPWESLKTPRACPLDASGRPGVSPARTRSRTRTPRSRHSIPRTCPSNTSCTRQHHRCSTRCKMSRRSRQWRRRRVASSSPGRGRGQALQRESRRSSESLSWKTSHAAARARAQWRTAAGNGFDRESEDQTRSVSGARRCPGGVNLPGWGRAEVKRAAAVTECAGESKSVGGDGRDREENRLADIIARGRRRRRRGVSRWGSRERTGLCRRGGL